MHKVLVDRLGGLSLPRKSVVRLTDRPDMTLDVYRGRKTTTQQQLLGLLKMLLFKSTAVMCLSVWIIRFSAVSAQYKDKSEVFHLVVTVLGGSSQGGLTTYSIVLWA